MITEIMKGLHLTSDSTDRTITASFTMKMDFGADDGHDPEELLEMCMVYDIREKTLAFYSECFEQWFPFSKIQEFVEKLKQQGFEVV